MHRYVLVVALLLPLVPAATHSQGLPLPSAPNDAPVPGTVPPGGTEAGPGSRQANTQRERQARRRSLKPRPGTTLLR